MSTRVTPTSTVTATSRTDLVHRGLGLMLCVVSIVLGGCSEDDRAGDDAPSVITAGAADGGPGDVSGAAPIDDSPFCRAMRALEDGDEPPTRREVIEAYIAIAPQVPAEIRPEFEVVLAHLQQQEATGATATGSTDPVVEESTLRLAGYVEIQCRGTAISPLPPPTQPGAANDRDD